MNAVQSGLRRQQKQFRWLGSVPRRIFVTAAMMSVGVASAPAWGQSQPRETTPARQEPTTVPLPAAETAAGGPPLENLIRDLETLTSELSSDRQLADPDSVRVELADRTASRREPISGLALGGQRVVILLDGSQSMLSTERTAAPTGGVPRSTAAGDATSWHRSIEIVRWLLARLGSTGMTQIVIFNEEARFLMGSAERWLDHGDAVAVEDALQTLRDDVVPSGRKNLQAALATLFELGPEPTDVYLITDDLPTLSRLRKTRNTRPARLDHFRDAFEKVHASHRLSVILMPHFDPPDGDLDHLLLNLAASSYWRIAMAAGGSLLSPAEDWP